MKRLVLAFAIVVISTLLNACSKGPGDLEGTWRLHGFVPMTVTYRSNEEEAMGIISEVSYEFEGNDVLVTYTSGIAEGHTVRFTRVDKNTYRSELGTLKRVR
ncbi:hypothetical protein J6J34_03855 [Pseudidiomarina sp. 1ASP75-14]|uniref:hypothetical protein n=1 Tax=Pseudidiomarina terrestris TaxID=2820060 RepID=UPI00264EE3EE|nr:hypothetical protein [Pseudidiomarina sp. 1ASP75-14]MDN7137354.1 hypothetical protein [Pseudidiomarina sp. 1ASP75-14]